MGATALCPRLCDHAVWQPAGREVASHADRPWEEMEGPKTWARRCEEVGDVKRRSTRHGAQHLPLALPCGRHGHADQHQGAVRDLK